MASREFNLTLRGLNLIQRVTNVKFFFKLAKNWRPYKL